MVEGYATCKKYGVVSWGRLQGGCKLANSPFRYQPMTNILPCSNLTLNEQRSGATPSHACEWEGCRCNPRVSSCSKNIVWFPKRGRFESLFSYFQKLIHVRIQSCSSDHAIEPRRSMSSERRKGTYASFIAWNHLSYLLRFNDFIGSFVPSVFSEARYPYFWDIHYSVMLTQFVHGNFGILHPKIFFLNAGMSILWNIDFVLAKGE